MNLETQNAGPLELRAVNQQALLDIILEMGGLEAITAGNFGADTGKAVTAANRMLTYCMGWGVVNDPPADALETLAALGKPIHLPQIARANWLRYIVLTNEEGSALIAAIMQLTFDEKETDGGG